MDPMPCLCLPLYHMDTIFTIAKDTGRYESTRPTRSARFFIIFQSTGKNFEASIHFLLFCSHFASLQSLQSKFLFVKEIFLSKAVCQNLSYQQVIKMTTAETSSKNPDQMSVSELRGWLSNFSKKQQDHHSHNQVQRRRSPIKIGRLSVRERVMGLERPCPAREDDANSEGGENNSQQENAKPGTSNSSRTIQQVSLTTRASSAKSSSSSPSSGPENRNENSRSSSSNSRRSANRNKPMFQLPRIESGKIYYSDSAGAIASPEEQAEESAKTSFDRAPQDTPFLDTVSSADSLKIDGQSRAPSAPTGMEEKPYLGDLSWTLSALTVASSSSSVEAEASGSMSDVAEDDEQEMFEPFGDTNKQNHKDIIFKPENFQVLKPNGPLKDLPETFSDFEPVNFDASISEASSAEESTDQESDKEERTDGDSGKDIWAAWNGDANLFLKQQSLPSLQGYWSDRDDEFDDEDGDTVATGLRTEPAGFRYGNARLTRKKNRRREPKFRGPGQFEEDFRSSFTLFDAAKASVASGKPRPGSKSLSDHFNSNVKTKASRNKIPRDAHSPTNESFHSANLFQDKTLTASTLDVICNERDRPESKYPHSSGNLENFIESGGQPSVTSNSLSEDSDRPSIAPDAVDPKLRKHFHLDDKIEEEATDCTAEQRQDINSRGKASSFDEMREEAPRGDSCRQGCGPREVVVEKDDDRFDGSSSHKKSWNPFPIKTSRSSDQTSTCEEVSPASSFSSMIEKFGGSGVGVGRPARKSRIQLQKEALEQQWAADRKPKHVKKTKWAVCRSSGTYKKKVVLDFE